MDEREEETTSGMQGGGPVPEPPAFLIRLAARLAGGAPQATLATLSDLGRNVLHIANPDPRQPPRLLLPPLEGRPISAAMLASLNTLAVHGHLTAAERAALPLGTWAGHGKGRPIDAAGRIQTMLLLLKHGQCGIAARGRVLEHLMGRYVARDRRLYPLGNEAFAAAAIAARRKALPKGQALASAATSRAFAAALTALILTPEDVRNRRCPAALADLRGRGAALGRQCAGLSAAPFDFGFVAAFFDLSAHDDGQLAGLLEALGTEIGRSPEEKLAAALGYLQPDLREVEAALGEDFLSLFPGAGWAGCGSARAS
ncbi:hypothetical protein, partial [Cereibacter sphaeroides]|uniref:hypothetical protein n=1 Tax=Cereibacter sphaeroides TaxID=1063 RepID=UPI001F1FE782